MIKLSAAVTLVITTVGLTVGVTSYFRSAKQADLDLASVDKKIEEKTDAIIEKMDERRQARDRELAAIKDKLDSNHQIYMEQFRRLDGYLSEFIRQQNARAEREGYGGGS